MSKGKVLAFFLGLALFWSNAFLSAQPAVEMADSLRASGKIYVVVAVILIIFAGLIAFLVMVDKKIKHLENNQTTNKQTPQ